MGAIAAGLAVALGAFGAHILADRVTPDRLETFKTGVQYHLIHALALMMAGWAASQWPGWPVEWAGYLFLAGIVLFSGSLYLLVLTDTRWLGAITPLGGVAFIAGWGMLAWAAFRGG
ncbi:MAG: DUF423 domain-containing protein, partial [Rhodothermales bacterium]